MARLLATLVLAVALLHSDALKILMYNPAMGHSHIAFQGAIADILIDAGHTVHMVIPEWNPALRSNGTTRAEKVYRFASSRPTKFINASFMADPFDSTNGDLIFDKKQFELFANTTNQYCDDILRNDDFLDELRSQKYDVAISELYEFCNWGWLHGIGIKTKIVISATPLTHMISEFYGIPTPTSYVSNVFASYPNAPQLTYSQRAMGIFGALFMHVFTPKFIADMDVKLRNKFGPDFPEVRTIVQNTSIALINAMDVLDLPKPISHKIVNVGGIAVKKPKAKLSPEIEQIFKKAKKGVVLFSFGSIADTRKMKPFMKKAFLNAFVRFPDYEFIWKFTPIDANESLLLELHENVHAVEWMDQTTILAQPKLRTFITHCGLNSLTEGAYAGKPMLAIPLFADQNYNAAIVVQRRIGVHVDISSVDEAKMTAALREVLDSDEFYNNAQRLQRKLLTHPSDPKLLVRQWVEYAAEFGDLHENLNLFSINIGFFRYHCLDIVIPVTVCVLLLLVLVLKTLTFVLRTATALYRAKAKVD